MFEQHNGCNDELDWRIVIDYDNLAVDSFKPVPSSHQDTRTSEAVNIWTVVFCFTAKPNLTGFFSEERSCRLFLNADNCAENFDME
jgi:hypothetical protein